MSNLILPGDRRYSETLANIPLFWNCNRNSLPAEGGAIIYDSDTGLPRVTTWKDAQEFLNDGEYDLRMKEIEASEDDDNWDDVAQEPHEITDDDLRANWEFMKSLGRI